MILLGGEKVGSGRGRFGKDKKLQEDKDLNGL